MSIHTIYAEYRKRVESHDEVICTGPREKGMIWPATEEEKKACKKFSDKVILYLFPQGEALGFTWVRYKAAMEDLMKGGGESA